MNNFWFDVFMLVLIAAFVFLLCFFGMLLTRFTTWVEKKMNKNSKPAKPKKKKVERVQVRATVVDQACGTKLVGIKILKLVKEFVVVFRTEDGKILELNVKEGMYDGFEIGQTGILTLVDGALYSFKLQ